MNNFPRDAGKSGDLVAPITRPKVSVVSIREHPSSPHANVVMRPWGVDQMQQGTLQRP